MRRIFVSTVVRFDADGNVTPMWIEWTNGEKYKIDKIVTVTRSSALHSDMGYRYLVLIRNQERELGFDGHRWFVQDHG